MFDGPFKIFGANSETSLFFGSVSYSGSSSSIVVDFFDEFDEFDELEFEVGEVISSVGPTVGSPGEESNVSENIEKTKCLLTLRVSTYLLHLVRRYDSFR
jgi:hypothetical protein